MKLKFIIIILFSFIGSIKGQDIEFCPRQNFLLQFPKIINGQIKEYNLIGKGQLGTCTITKDERPRNFYVYDLVDTTNNSFFQQCVSIDNNHIYLFAPYDYISNYNSICFVLNDSLIVFPFINHPKNEKYSINDVLNFYDKYYPIDLKNDNLKERLTTCYNGIRIPKFKCQKSEIVHEFASIIKKYHINFNETNFCSVTKDEHPDQFFIYDLVDTMNYSLFNNCIYFKENHIYHFSPYNTHLEASSICFILKGELHIFPFFDHPKNDKYNFKGVLDFYDKKYPKYLKNKELRQRLVNYKEYGFYYGGH